MTVSGDALDEDPEAAAAAGLSALLAPPRRELLVRPALLPTRRRAEDDDAPPVWLLCPATGGDVAEAEDAALLPAPRDLLTPPRGAPSLDKRALLFRL